MRKGNPLWICLGICKCRQGKDIARYGITNFRVITVTPTEQRALNLCQTLRKAGLAFNRFWFTDLDSVSPGEPSKNPRKGLLYAERF